MYGGGFATIPAYLRDMFGTMHVGRHSRPAVDRMVGRGRAWVRCWSTTSASTRSTRGVPKAQAYSVTMYIMCALLLIGFICNFCMRAVNEKYHYRTPAETREV